MVLIRSWVAWLWAGSLLAQIPAELPAPKPSVIMERQLEAITRRAEAEPAEALEGIDRLLTAAQESADGSGEAQAYRWRALVLQRLGRSEAAIAAWQEAAAAWARTGDGPGRVEAWAAAGLLMAAKSPVAAESLFAVALTLGQTESKRPQAAAQALYAAGSALFEERYHLSWAHEFLTAALVIKGRQNVPPLEAAQLLNQLGAVAYAQADLVAAREYHHWALTIQEAWAPDSLDVAQSLNGLGLVAYAEGDWAIAQAYHCRALAIQEKQAPHSLEVARSLNHLGLIFHEQGSFAEATAYHERARSIREQQAPHSLDLAMTFYYLGMLHRQQGKDLATARKYLEQARSIQEKLAPQSLHVAKTLNGLALLATWQRDFAQAEACHHQALAIREALAPESLDLAATLHNLGLLAEWKGDLIAAKDYYQRALLIQQSRAPNSSDVANNLDRLGAIARLEGDLVTARRYLEWALLAREKVPDSVAMVRILNNLGQVAHAQWEQATAKDYYQRALKIQRKLYPNTSDVAYSLISLGHVAYTQGDLSDAKTYYQEALDLDQKIELDPLRVATILSSLGQVALRERNLAAASAYQKRTLEILAKWAPNSLLVAWSLQTLGLVAYSQSDLISAEKYFHQALDLLTNVSPNSLEMASSVNGLGIVAYRQGDLEKAERYARRAWALVRQQASMVTRDDPLQGFGAFTAEYATNLVRYQVALGKKREALITLEESRAQALRWLMFERQVAANARKSDRWPMYWGALEVRDRAEQAVYQAFMAKTRAEQAFEAQRRKGAGPSPLEQAQASVVAATERWEKAESDHIQARAKADKLWAEIEKTIPRAVISVEALEQAPRALPAGTLFIAFSVGEKQMDVLVLRAGGDLETALSVYTVGITHEALQKLVDKVRLQVANPPSRWTAGMRANQDLFAKIFPQEVQRVLHTAQRLLISPDGPLWNVSFAALITNAVGVPHYLGLDTAITYTPSLAWFMQAQKSSSPLAKGDKVSAVVVGNPTFDRALPAATRLRPKRPGRTVTKYASSGIPAKVFGVSEWSALLAGRRFPDPLPETEVEASAIAKLYGGELLTRERATEAALREHLATADLIHLATHGYFHPQRAMSSGVLLAPPETEPEAHSTDNDGALQAWEIYSQLRLKAELVVLSACESGRGQNVRSEGPIGLTRALLYAGARAVVASQWKVADRSTSRVMVAFHRYLRQGVSKDEALRRAMAAVHKDPTRAHPYYWAAFFLVGDPNNPNLGLID